MAVLGGSLKRRERMSARLGDVLSQLYLTTSTLKRFDDDGRQKEDLALVHWSVQDSLHQAEQAIDGLLSNFPNRFVAGAMRFILLPTGLRRQKPSDKLDHKLARILQEPSGVRSRIGRGLFLEASRFNPVGKMEEALIDILTAEPIYDRVCKESKQRLPFMQLDRVAKVGLELNIISDKEALLLRKAEKSRLATINVDDFDPSELIVKPQNHSVEHSKIA